MCALGSHLLTPYFNHHIPVALYIPVEILTEPFSDLIAASSTFLCFPVPFRPIVQSSLLYLLMLPCVVYCARSA